MTMTIGSRVAAGVALLDREQPGWDAGIDLAVLDLSSCQKCIIGQLFGAGHERDSAAFAAGLAKLGFPAIGDEDSEHGFALLGGLASGGMTADEEFGALTAEWRRVIAARRLARTAVTACGA